METGLLWSGTKTSVKVGRPLQKENKDTNFKMGVTFHVKFMLEEVIWK